MEKLTDCKFLQVFGKNKPEDWNQRIILPVVHVKPGAAMSDSAYQGAMTAYEAGADGVLLIDMNGDRQYQKLAAATVAARARLAAEGVDFLIGVNFLDLTYHPGPTIFAAKQFNIPMIWSDNQGMKDEWLEAFKVNYWDGIYLGAVAFKYQEVVYGVESLRQAAKDSTWMDVSVTSGEGTGKAIDLAKATVFAEAIPNHPKGIASGVSVANIKSLLPWFNVFVVATSICSDNDELDPVKTKDLVAYVHGWELSD